MARWRALDGPPARIEPPGWYRTFTPADWDAPDAHEQAMIDGCPGWRPWPEHLHAAHARRRWGQARFRYCQEHPDLAEQELADLETRGPDRVG